MIGASPVPLLLGFILGPQLEENLGRALVLSRGSFSIFVDRPYSLGLIILAIGSIVAAGAVQSWRRYARNRRQAVSEPLRGAE